MSKPLSELAIAASFLSPGMARVVERLIAAHLVGMPITFSDADRALLAAAAMALSVVNGTPGAAQKIGRKAASVIEHNPSSRGLVLAARPMIRPVPELTAREVDA